MIEEWWVISDNLDGHELCEGSPFSSREEAQEWIVKSGREFDRYVICKAEQRFVIRVIRHNQLEEIE